MQTRGNHRLNKQSRRIHATAGFSLFELLVVMGVLSVLAGISFAAFHRTSDRARNAQATAQIQRLGIALEQYRSQYGDFPVILPQTEGSADLLIEALLGERSPSGQLLDPPERSFLDLGDFTREEENAREVASIDPWGNPWVYVYAPALENWSLPGFILYSRGPSGEHNPPTITGTFDPNHPANRDNISYE